MPDIFISYARSDRTRVEPLAVALARKGWDVWWDPSILPGDSFRTLIEGTIARSKCMVVVWSTASVASHWVEGEATMGRERGILVPVLFDDVRPPVQFLGMHAANLTRWDGDTDTVDFASLCAAIGQRAGTPAVTDPFLIAVQEYVQSNRIGDAIGPELAAMRDTLTASYAEQLEKLMLNALQDWRERRRGLLRLEQIGAVVQSDFEGWINSEGREVAGRAAADAFDRINTRLSPRLGRIAIAHGHAENAMTMSAVAAGSAGPNSDQLPVGNALSNSIVRSAMASMAFSGGAGIALLLPIGSLFGIVAAVATLGIFGKESISTAIGAQDLPRAVRQLVSSSASIA